MSLRCQGFRAVAVLPSTDSGRGDSPATRVGGGAGGGGPSRPETTFIVRRRIAEGMKPTAETTAVMRTGLLARRG